jgi:DnaK suppressor protein
MLRKMKKKRSIQGAIELERKPQRFSDEELGVFRTLILARVEETEIEVLQAARWEGRICGQDLPSESLYKEKLDTQLREQRSLLKELSQALKRIDAKTYGVCSISGKLIDKSQLIKVPYLTIRPED